MKRKSYSSLILLPKQENLLKKEAGKSCNTATNPEENFRDHILWVPDYSCMSIVLTPF